MIREIIFILLLIILITVYVTNLTYENLEKFIDDLENKNKAYVISKHKYIENKVKENFNKTKTSTDKNNKKSIVIVDNKVWMQDHTSYLSISIKSKRLSNHLLNNYFDQT